MMAERNPFKSFWMGGYECADHLNSSGNRVDLLTTTYHIEKLKEDYDLLLSFNIKTVREGLRWSQVEKQPYAYDFSTVTRMLDHGIESGIQQIWDICHFGFPDDLSPLHPHFTHRFTSFCIAFAKFYASNYPGLQLIVTPINEVSFLSWLGGEVGATSPFAIGNGWNVKYALIKAYIQGIVAMKDINPYIKILSTEPLVNIVPPVYPTEEEASLALKMHEEQYQALDMLTGKICPELGGSTELVDIIGLNYYHNNQWVLGFSENLSWYDEVKDTRWRSFSDLAAEAYQRYNKPIMLAETSHPGEERPAWIAHIKLECLKILEMNIPLLGVCLYPIIDRPDWDDLSNWHHSGLWDQQTTEDNFSLRILHQPYAEALRLAQISIDSHFIENDHTVIQ